MGKLIMIVGVVIAVIFAGLMLYNEFTGRSLINQITGIRRIPYLYQIQMAGVVGGIALIGLGVMKMKAEQEQ